VHVYAKKGNNEEHEKATKPIARSESHPWRVKHTSPCLPSICECEQVETKVENGRGPIYNWYFLGHDNHEPILTEGVVVTTIAVVGAASGCPLVMMHFCAPETVSTVDVVRRLRVR
jgi:hypothetical protein